MSQHCGNCRWFRSMADEAIFLPDKVSMVGGYDLGQCRRYGPEPGESVLLKERHTWALWPITRAEDWCGEWTHALS